MPRVELIQSPSLDYVSYANFLKEAYRDLLLSSDSSDSFMTPEFYRWKYRTPAGNARIARMTESNEIISSSAMIPFQLTCDGETITGWQCLDVATLPKARKKGHFFTTLKSLMTTVESDEIFFAFPNAGSIPAFRKLDCHENTLLTTWINPRANIIKKKSKAVRTVERFGMKQDLFAGKLRELGPSMEHTSIYLNWRYLHHPNNAYAFFVHENGESRNGFCVARLARALGKEIILIMELWGLRPSVETELLRHVCAWGVEHGRRMVVMMNTNISLPRAFTAFFLPVPSFLLPKRQVLVVSASNPKGRALLKKKWKIQTGDWDVF